MYCIMLVEDDSMQRKLLKKIILSVSDEIKIYEAESENQALDVMKDNDIDMFFIDIGLKESSGLDLGLKIRKINRYEFSHIVFLTTHLEYILQAFKQTHCYDYILKPYDKKEVQAMVSKFIKNENNNVVKSEDNCIQDQDNEKEFIIKIRNGIYVSIKINEILFIEVKGRECEINTENRVYTYSNISLRKLLKLIDSNHIVQSHRAFAINKNYIFKIEKLDTKLSSIYFKNSSKTALLGYKFKNDIMSEFKNSRVLLC